MSQVGTGFSVGLGSAGLTINTAGLDALKDIFKTK